MTLRSRCRTWLYYWIDRADCWVVKHPRTPMWIQRPVYGAWCWMMGRGTWTAVGDDLPNPFEQERGYAEIPCRWDEDGDAIDWMRFSRTHDWADTCDQGCVIHNRTDHHMALWPLHWRGDRGIFERICSHGIGHPDPDQGPYWRATDQDWQWVHGCDGCCGAPDPVGRLEGFLAHPHRPVAQGGRRMNEPFCTHRWDSSNLGNPGLCECQREADHFGTHRCGCGATIRYVTDWKADDETD